MTTLTTNSIFATFLSDVGQVLSQNLPLILGILAALVGLGIVILYFSKFIGGSSVKKGFLIGTLGDKIYYRSKEGGYRIYDKTTKRTEKV